MTPPEYEELIQERYRYENLCHKIEVKPILRGTKYGTLAGFFLAMGFVALDYLIRGEVDQKTIILSSAAAVSGPLTGFGAGILMACEGLYSTNDSRLLSEYKNNIDDLNRKMGRLE